MKRRRPNRNTRARRRRRTTSWLVLSLLVGLGSLFLMAWQTHEIHELQARRSELTLESSFQADELRRLQVRWYRSTQREHVVSRAGAELGLTDASPEVRQVVAIPGRRNEESGPQWLRDFALGLDRFGDIADAMARSEDSR